MSIRLASAIAFALVAAATAADPPPLEFHRVHVPAGRLGDVPLDGGRYVPMPLAEFDAAVARARTGAAVEPVAPVAAARWVAAIDDSGLLVGTVSCDVGPDVAGPGRVLPLHDLVARRAVRVGEPPEAALVCGIGGGLAVAVPRPGTYEFEFERAPVAERAAAFHLPLVPALVTTIDLDLAPGLRPVLSGAAARHAVVTPPAAAGGATWRIAVGPAADVGIAVGPDLPPPGVAVWADVELFRSRAALAAVVVPAGPWRSGRLVLEQDAALRVTDVRALDDDEPLDHEPTADGRVVKITVPRWLDGRRTPLVLRGVAPATGAAWQLPLVRAPAASWTGGGIVVRIDPALAARNVEMDDCRMVPPETAAAWPRAAAFAATDGGDPARPAVYAAEQQGPAAACRIEVGERPAVLEVARVTTVEITSGAVLGRAACDVRVAGGEAFQVEARVATGWIIDSVDAIDWSDDAEVDGAAPADRVLDWRVVRSPAGDVLRIGLAAAATARRGIGLRITGHRGRLAPGAVFTMGDVDMVRFDGESVDAAVIDLRTGPDAYVEIAGQPAGWFEVDERLEPLVEEGAARGRIRGGERAADVQARVVRRRPPLDVAVDIRLEPRADALVQTFTLDCRAAGGVESLVVDFAEPGGDGLAWRVESPAGVTAAARPREPAEGGLASRSDAIAASWLVELTPPPSGPVLLRAVRSVPFTEPVPVPLAWVEGAMEPGGTVVVAAAGGVRPRLVNHRLRELPTGVDAGAVQAEFAFDAPLPGAAAELLPAARGADARAWAWRESVACWCDESGAVESESRFEVENEGRASLALALAPGRRLESVLVDDVPPPGVEFGPAGGTWRIPLPPGERRVEIVVRTVAGGRAGLGAWRVDPFGCSLDLPVLDRDVRLLVPPGLVVASAVGDRAATGTASWGARLTGLGTPTDSGDCQEATGFRCVPVSAVRAGDVLVVRRTLVAGAAVVAACVLGVAVFLRRGARSASAGLLLVVAAAVAALWVPVAFVPVARAAWWGAIVGLACGWWRGGMRPMRWWPARAVAAAGCIAVLVAHPLPVVAADAGVRVFVTPGTGGDTALVPEPLFRALAGASVQGSAAIRVLACRITARGGAGGENWPVALDVDADAGGTVVLDAGPGARWVERPSAGGVRVVVAGREVRLTAVEPGRHGVNLALVPAVERAGPVETVAARVPVAPATTFEVAPDLAAGGIVCERAAGGGPFTRAGTAAEKLGGAVFDVSGADRVRLVRTVDPAVRLARGVRAADTVDEVSWGAGGCSVEAVIDLDAGPDLLRSVVVQVDPRLDELGAAVDDAAAPRLVPLGEGRVLVEFAEPVRGRARARLSARLPLADPVGVFDVPGIWLAGVPIETRTIRLEAAADLDAELDPAPVDGATAAEFDDRSPPRLVVRRSRQQVRGIQNLAVSFTPSGIGLVLEAQIDAGTLALTRIPVDVPIGCIVDRVELLTDDEGKSDSREVVDALLTRVAADRVVLLVQRPRPGRSRLRVEARLVRRPAPRGRLPVVRARLGPFAPLLVSWTAEPPLSVTVDGRDETSRSDTIEVPEGEAEPSYVLAARAEPESPAESAPAAAAERKVSRVERTEIRAAFDGRGRVHGLARFDVVAAEPSVPLRLPSGMRLFDVLVDGRPAAAEPRATDVWDVPLGTASWPRTILVVFAGDAGPGLFAGGALALAPPRLEGLPAAEVFWAVRPPAGHALTVAPPVRPLDAATRDAARDRVAAAFERVVAGSVGRERRRLEALRREERGPAAEEEWWRADGWEATQADFVTADAAEPLVIRAVPVPDGTVPGRGLATVALIAIGGLAWVVATRARA